jgi:hypothetical protein
MIYLDCLTKPICFFTLVKLIGWFGFGFVSETTELFFLMTSIAKGLRWFVLLIEEGIGLLL